MARKLEVEIVGDASSLHKAIGSADSKTSSFGKTLGGLGKAGALAAGAAGVGALIYTLKTGIGEFAASQKVAAQTRAVIKSTGGVANVTAGQVAGLATSLMKKSGVDDEVIASGENMLLTFKNIRNEAGKGNDIFNQSSKTLLDMSVALGEDVPHAAIRLGKALNDPIKGISALTRVGVTFTDGQKATIKSLVESGHTMEAQRMILKELNSEFGGSAEAAGKTLPGMISIARESFNNWAGDLVGKTIPVLKEVISWLRDHWPEISAALGRFWADVKPIFVNLIGIVVGVVDAIRDHWSTIGPIVEGVAKTFEDAFKIIGDILKVISALLRGDWSQAWSAFKDAVGAAINGIETIIQTEARVLIAIMSALGNALKAAVVAGLKGIGNAAWGVINNIGDAVSNNLGAAVRWGEGLGSKIKSGVVGGIGAIGNAAWGELNNIGAAISRNIQTIAGWGGEAGRAIKGALLDSFSGIGQAVFNALKMAINAVIRAWNALEVPGFDIGFKINTHIPGVGTIHAHVGFPSIDLPDIPKLALGGPLTAGQAAIIGEKGAELFVPRQAGTVVPMAGGAGQTAASKIPIQLVLPDGRVVAEWLIDPLRNQARIVAQRTGKPAFS